MSLKNKDYEKEANYYYSLHDLSHYYEFLFIVVGVDQVSLSLIMTD